MSIAPVVVGAVSGGLVLAGAAALGFRPRLRLGPRVRPYSVVSRSLLGLDVHPDPDQGPVTIGGVAAGLFGPPLRALAVRLRRLSGPERGEEIALRLRRSGLGAMSVDEYRVRVAGATAIFAAAGATVGGALVGSALGALGLAVCGAAYGATRSRSRLDGSIAQRRERIRLELATVNHLLAIHVRAGAGAIQAATRLVARGQGIVVEELDAALTWVRSGVGEAEAFRRAADLTPEPGAARTYRLLATAAERGADLAHALRAVSEDLRNARRDEIRRTATRRRAAMLVPTIAVLAPVMLLFIAAPLPSIVFGSR